jgi:signal transduction histidine kinase
LSKEILRKVPLFEQLAEPDLDRLCSLTRPMPIKSGKVLMEEGAPGDSMYVVVDGDFEVTKRSGKQEVVLGHRGPGEVLGEMSLLDQSPRSASVRALVDSHVIMISQVAFQQVLACSPSAVVSVLNTVTSRMRSMQALLIQSEKLAGLGTLAAGLAHELNNPAAASLRSTTILRERLAEWQRLTSSLEEAELDAAQRAALARLRARMADNTTSSAPLELLARSDREYEIEEWLDDHGVGRAWEIAPVLATSWDVQSLDELAETFQGEQLSLLCEWLAAGVSTYSLLDEVKTGVARISTLVGEVKTYSHLDQAPIQQVDLAESIESALTMLKHKLHPALTIKREYAETPHVEAYASELNQVWTNLIDNAIDALGEKGGEITLRVYPQGECAVVEIADNGSGIPEDTRSHIFEPFFTTKEPGKGTGLGLHIVYNIIVEKHRGRIEVESEPGATTFRITLPMLVSRE